MPEAMGKECASHSRFHALRGAHFCQTDLMQDLPDILMGALMKLFIRHANRGLGAELLLHVLHAIDEMRKRRTRRTRAFDVSPRDVAAVAETGRASIDQKRLRRRAHSR